MITGIDGEEDLLRRGYFFFRWPSWKNCVQDKDTRRELQQE